MPALSGIKQLGQAVQNYAGAANPSGASNADYQGILSKYAGNANDQYYNQWKADLDAGKLAGSPLWFYENYAEQKKGDDAIAKQAQIEKQLAAAQYGQQQQGLQSGLTGAGLGKSGFAGDELQNLSAQENFTFGDIYNRMLDLQQQNRQNNENRWQQESFMNKERRAGKKNRRTQILSAGLSAGGMALGGMLGGPAGAAGAGALLGQV